MSKLTRFRLIILLLVSHGVVPSVIAAGDRTEPTSLIFDTDLGNDVDDALALGMIHAMESRGECKLLAVTLTKDHELAAPFADAINTFYGRGDIPIGVCRSGVTPEPGRFNPLADAKQGNDFRYPHDLLSGKDAPDAVTVLRKALAASKNGTVAIAQVGFSTNLANLLQSPPDEISPLTGRELVKAKVKLLSIMAGAFTKIPDRDGKPYDHREYNIIKDIPAAKRLATSWPTPIVWSGYEIGIAVPYPHESIEQDYRYAEHHPLAEAYIAYNPPPHNRPTWDLTSVLYAIRPTRDYFDLSQPGRVSVADDGLTTFSESIDGQHRYLKLTEPQKIRVTATLVGLSSEPPKRGE